MYFCFMSRQMLVEHLPVRAEVAEIGVAAGEFSRHILKTAVPRRLHLIDPWVHQTRQDYANDPINGPNEEHDARFQGVKKAFASEITAGTVVLHRAYSTEIAPSFADGQFDWIYLDAMHTQDSVSADLKAFHSKVKADGFLVGHDYTNHIPAQRMNFGVIEAVNDFLAEHREWTFVALTCEWYPTYLLARRDSPTIAPLLDELLTNYRAVEIRDPNLNGGFKHTLFTFGNKIIPIASF